MPRKKLDLALSVEHLSILNENGELDRDLEPDIPEDRLVKLHRFMVLGRKFDDRFNHVSLLQGAMGDYPPCSVLTL